LCPIKEAGKWADEQKSWDVEQVLLDMKKMKIKAKACKNFEDAFEQAKKSVDERHGLVVITGSHAVIHEYWHHKGIKKF
jgi:folylpolyglutamate synthase/dihydropteroate synthase